MTLLTVYYIIAAAALVAAAALAARRDWRVVRTIWPYPHGYGVYSRSRRTIAASGLSREAATAYARRLNRENS